MCASLCSLCSHSSVSSALSFRRHVSSYRGCTLTAWYMRYATYSSELVCSENLTPGSSCYLMRDTRRVCRDSWLLMPRVQHPGGSSNNPSLLLSLRYSWLVEGTGLWSSKIMYAKTLVKACPVSSSTLVTRASGFFSWMVDLPEDLHRARFTILNLWLLFCFQYRCF